MPDWPTDGRVSNAEEEGSRSGKDDRMVGAGVVVEVLK
jgi:hypothetical protein